MEGFINKKHNCTHLSTTQKSLAIHKNSHSISKQSNNNIIINKPKIRIIHIFAPEIIKTDVENFRELVQRLTGKPTEKDCLKSKKKTITTTRPRVVPRRDHDDHEDDCNDDQNKKLIFPFVKKLDMNKTTSGFLGFDHHSGFDVMMMRDQSVVKEELDQEEGEELWNINSHNHNHHQENNNNNISSGGFLDRLDFEGFIEELDHQFPLLPSLLNPNLDSSSHFQYGFGPQLA